MQLCIFNHTTFRIITSDWGLADWVQRLIGANRVCYASEVSRVDPGNRCMEMHSKNLSFCSYVNMEEKMTYVADPADSDKTLLRQEMIVTVRGVPLTSYMEGIIVNTVSSNSSKGKAAIEWVVEKLGQECRYYRLSDPLDNMNISKFEMSTLSLYLFCFQGSQFIFLIGQAEKRNSRP